jgi:Ca2+/H+ antiporter
VTRPKFTRSDLVVMGGCALAVLAAGVTRYATEPSVLAFAVAAVAVAMLASLVGRSVEQLGDRFGAGATGVLQGALGNLPELFIGFFALKAGLVAVVLLVVFALSLPASLKRTPAPSDAFDDAGAAATPEPHEQQRWPIWLAVGMLALSSVAAALVSDWFVYALEPAIETLGISQAFAGLVVVAIAGNAVENVIGIRLAYLNRADYALSVVINSPLQVALVLAPVLVLLSFLTATTLTLVFAPMLVMAVAITVLAVTFIVFDGESTWLEGATLIALYAIIAAVFWWG